MAESAFPVPDALPDVLKVYAICIVNAHICIMAKASMTFCFCSDKQGAITSQPRADEVFVYHLRMYACIYRRFSRHPVILYCSSFRDPSQDFVREILKEQNRTWSQDDILQFGAAYFTEKAQSSAISKGTGEGSDGNKATTDSSDDLVELLTQLFLQVCSALISVME